VAPAGGHRLPAWHVFCRFATPGGEGLPEGRRRSGPPAQTRSLLFLSSGVPQPPAAHPHVQTDPDATRPPRAGSPRRPSAGGIRPISLPHRLLASAVGRSSSRPAPTSSSNGVRARYRCRWRYRRRSPRPWKSPQNVSWSTGICRHVRSAPGRLRGCRRARLSLYDSAGLTVRRADW